MSSKDKFQQVDFGVTKYLMKKVETGVNAIAGIRISYGLTTLEFEAEAARVERCIEFQYKSTRGINTDYLEFAIDLIMKNGKALIFNNEYAGMYIEDVQNVYYKDDLTKVKVEEGDEDEDE